MPDETQVTSARDPRAADGGSALELHPHAARRWTPKRVLVTPAALDEPHGQRIVARVEALGIEVERLRANRLVGLRGETERETYARAKSTLAVVVSPPADVGCSRSPPAPTGASTSPRAARRTASTATSPARCPARP